MVEIGSISRSTNKKSRHPRMRRNYATATLMGLGVACSAHSAFALPQVYGKPAIVDIGGETVILATGVDGHLNIYRGWSGYDAKPGGGSLPHYRDTTSPSSFERADLGLPPDGHGISNLSAAPYYNSNGIVVGAWIYGMDYSTKNTLQGLVTIGGKNTNGTYSLPPTFSWKSTIGPVNTGYQGVLAQPAPPVALSIPGSVNLAGTHYLFGIINESFGGSAYFPLMKASAADSSDIPSSPNWLSVGTGGGCNPPDSYMLNPSAVAYSVNSSPYERVYMNGGTTGLVYIASSSDRGSTWSWLRPTGWPNISSLGPGHASTFTQLSGGQEIDYYAPGSDGNVWEISNLHGSSRYNYNNLGAPSIGSVSYKPANIVSASYSNAAQNKQAVYVFGLANGVSNRATPGHSDVVMDYWLGGTGWSWNDLYSPQWPMSVPNTSLLNASNQQVWVTDVNAPALMSTKRADGGQRLVAAEVCNDGHMYTRTVDNDNFADDPAEMKGSSSHNWISQEPLWTTPGIDLIVTSVTMSPTTVHPGDAVRFTAVVKNVGSSPTPTFTPVGVQFAIDNPYGNYTSGAVTWDKTYTYALQPGESVTLTATAGNDANPNHTDKSTWIAVAGQHTVRAWADDIQRFYEFNSDYSHHQLKTATFTVQ